MSRLVCLLLALFVAVPAHAQTCLGVLRLTFVDPASTARPRPDIYIRDLDVRAQFIRADIPAGTAPPADSVSVIGSRAAHLAAYADAYVSGTVLSLSPECGTSLLHLVLVHHHETMTLDLYNVPNHIGLDLDAPVPFRPGRFVFDFDTAQRVSWNVFSAADVRPAGR